MKRLFVVDWALVAAFPLTAVTGLMLHAAGHGASHDVWHNTAVAHVVAGLLFLVFGAGHVWMHRVWHRHLGRALRRGRLTLLLTVVSAFVTVSGVALLGISGGGSGVGLWHYGAGLLLCLCSVAHVLGRLSPLRKSLGR